MNKDFPNIAVVLYDNLKPECADIAQNLIDLTEFKLCGQYQFNLYQTKTLTEELKKLADQGYEWASIVAAGNFLQNQTLININDYQLLITYNYLELNLKHLV